MRNEFENCCADSMECRESLELKVHRDCLDNKVQLVTKEKMVSWHGSGRLENISESFSIEFPTH
jgi:hypothetical protein